MSDRSRAERRDDLLTALGMLVDPIRRAILGIDDPAIKIPYIRGQFEADYREFIQKIFEFGREGKVHFDAECNNIKRLVWRSFTDLLTDLGGGKRSGEEMDRFAQLLQVSQDAIRTIPTDDPDVILPGASPFQTYLRLRALCSGSVQRIELFDAFLDDTPFHRYLGAVSPSAYIVVVTSKQIMQPSSGGTTRRDRIVSVSELVAAERKDRYRFLVTEQQHDRHLRVDEEILHLGGSVKDASRTAPYTIGTLDPTQSINEFLDSVIAGAEEWFGPTVTTHRRS